MPIFVDRHRLIAVPSTTRHQLHLEAMNGLVDRHGVRPLSNWLADGVIYCIVEASDREAFCTHHAERGLPCDDLHVLPQVGGGHPFSEDDTQRVRSAIASLWPADYA